jgi:hypothetical protein
VGEGDLKMSQQEFVPQSQQSQGPRSEGQQPLSEDEIYYPQHPYNWSTGENKAGPTRDEPPSSYDEVIMQRSYQAQSRTANTQRQEQAHKSSADSRSGWQQRRLRQQLSPDGDAYEESYRAYKQYNSWQSVPSWARPQPQGKSVVRLAVLIVLGLLLIKPLLIVAGVLLAVIGGIIGIAFLVIVLPIIFAVGIVSIILIAFRVASWQRRIRYR